MRYFILIIALCLPSILSAKIWDDNAKVSDLGDFYVYIIDGATGGCWTNISESIDYAEGKLKALGINVVKPQPGFPTDRQGTALINPNMTARITVDLRAAVQRDNPAVGKSAIVRISPLCILTTLGFDDFLTYIQVTDSALGRPWRT